MAAIKHLRSMEAYALQLFNEMSYAADAASKEDQHLLKCVLHDLWTEVGTLRDRINRLRQAQEASEAVDPRINPLARSERIEMRFLMPSDKVGVDPIDLVASIPAHGEQAREIQARILALVDGKSTGLSATLKTVGIVNHPQKA